jgi:hypothetical protein
MRQPCYRTKFCRFRTLFQTVAVICGGGVHRSVNWQSFKQHSHCSDIALLAWAEVGGDQMPGVVGSSGGSINAQGRSFRQYPADVNPLQLAGNLDSGQSTKAKVNCVHRGGHFQAARTACPPEKPSPLLYRVNHALSSFRSARSCSTAPVRRPRPACRPAPCRVDPAR